MVKGSNPIIISQQIQMQNIFVQSKRYHPNILYMHTQIFKCHTEKQLASPSPLTHTTLTAIQTSLYTHTHTGQLFLTSMTPWWMEVYCFFLSITKVMTITVAMTTPPTIRPMMAPLLEPTSSAKKTCGEVRDRQWSGDPSVARTQPITGSVVMLMQ